jgi:hypothetical protein
MQDVSAFERVRVSEIVGKKMTKNIKLQNS